MPIEDIVEVLRALHLEPSEILVEGDSAPPDFSKLSGLPVIPDQKGWWQAIRNAYGLQMVILKAILVKQDNFIRAHNEQYQMVLDAVKLLLEEDASDEDLQLPERPIESITDLVEPVEVDSTVESTVDAPKEQIPAGQIDPWGLPQE